VLRRALRYQAGFGMLHVVNFTDVDDRTILESQKAGVPLREYTDRFIEAFRTDAVALGLEQPEHTPRATDDENIAAMGQMVAALEVNGHTYRSDGSIYFSIATLPDYGKLARLDHAGIKAGARVDADKYDKENARDFVLWKLKADEPAWAQWDAPFGRGRPGWHIECSAMSMAELGETFDIHAGGVDLIFPHHEDEIAQSEGATGKPFVRYWLHGEFLLLEGDKMAKSTGNLFDLQDLVERGVNPSAIRYLFLTAHYRSKLNFTLEALEGAREAVRRIHATWQRLRRHPAVARIDL
jgi:cysteinyl-tRNA synthetase